MIYQKKPENFNPKFEIVGCFLEYQDKILLLHRQDNTSQGNTWGIPGGKIEKGETPIDAAIREASEEAGFHIPGFIDCGIVYIKYPTYDYIYHMFKGKLSSDQLPSDVKINFKEHKGFTWVTPQDALKMDLMLDEDPCIRLVYSCENW